MHKYYYIVKDNSLTNNTEVRVQNHCRRLLMNIITVCKLITFNYNIITIDDDDWKLLRYVSYYTL